ncbi:DUF4156 domain-containing protein [Roseobacter sp. HKCCA0434]|uniref:DUF4156 domain-containing protein n=1 Tax=Roseobacter sp. HKCCA0434 TaxID=3079297 RepID=UPI00290590A0|nr:DUF4156 domain-containing protein [Roseobacter sp. HKCCA0434]
MRDYIALIAFMLISSCSTELTSQGKTVRQISSGTSESCEFLGPITASESMGLDIAMDMESAFNQVRNEVALRGGNAFVVSASSTSEFSTVVQADAYNC